MINPFKLLFNYKESGLSKISREQYTKDFLNDEEIRKAALEKAWASRNFEIDLYWKRATYFWAFLVPTFAGYFAIVNSTSYNGKDAFDHIEVYIIICIGFVISIAWTLINQGSKSWQRHWEVHIDLLENSITGPLYKTTHPVKTFSVSKINDIVSLFFAYTWIMLGIKYFLTQGISLYCFPCEPKWLILLATVGPFLALIAMIFGYGRGHFSNREVSMHRRSITYVDNDNTVN